MFVCFEIDGPKYHFTNVNEYNWRFTFGVAFDFDMDRDVGLTLTVWGAFSGNKTSKSMGSLGERMTWHSVRANVKIWDLWVKNKSPK